MSRLAVLVVVGLGAFLALGARVDQRAYLPGDREAFEVLDGLRSAWSVDLVALLTDVGSFPAVAALVVATIALARPGAQGWALLAGLIVLVIVVGEAKEHFMRPRPEGMLADARGLAYPSGHSAYATAWPAAALVARRSRWLVAAAAFILVAVMVSRPYLHVHYLSDTIGGAALGVAVFAGCALAARALKP